MNYLVAVDTFFPDRSSGSARVAWDVSQLMRDRGHKVTIFCRKQKFGDHETSRHDGVDVVRFQLPRTLSVSPGKVRAQIRAGMKTARTRLANTRWDVIHIHLPLQGNIVYALFGPQARYVYTVHSPMILEQQINWSGQGLPGKIKWALGRGQLKRLEGSLLARVDRIHTLSQFTRDKIDGFYGLGENITVIPHWCREDFSREYSKERSRAVLGWPEQAKVLFSVRRLVPRMGLDLAIRAVATLMKSHPDLYFALAGAGPLERDLKQLAGSLGVSDRVWFLGRVDDDTLKRLYEAADVFILPTLALECFGLIVLEALAFGLPVISTDAGAIPELMRPILPNCIVPAGSVSALQDKIRTYLSGGLVIPGSEELQRYVFERFSKSAVAPQLTALLEDWD